METCYEYFACKEKECIMFQNQSDKPCWDTKGTLCCFPIIELIENTTESEKCNFCLYRNEYDINHIPTDNVFELQNNSLSHSFSNLQDKEMLPKSLIMSSIVCAPSKIQHLCGVSQQGAVRNDKNAGLGETKAKVE